MEEQQAVWRDEETRLPMHSHTIELRSNDGGISHLRRSYMPCSCGDTTYDVPLSLVQQNNKEEQKGQ